MLEKRTGRRLEKEIYGEVPEVVHNAVLDALDRLEEPCSLGRRRAEREVTERQVTERKRTVLRLPRLAVACVLCLLLCGISVSAVNMMNLYKQRMQDMNREVMEEYYDIAAAGETIVLNRNYTEQERARYEVLKEAYEKNGLFPKNRIPYLQGANAYTGKEAALDITTSTVYLPDRELSDEELLEIIDMQHKVVYSIYKQNEERITSGSDWQSRMAALSDEEVDAVYLTLCSTTCDVSGGYNREMSEAEESRYEELTHRYEQDGVFAAEDMTVIQTPMEYDGTGIAVCVETGSYFFPERELTDEEILQLIDLQHKETYCLDRLHSEIQMGLREGYPRN